jgi:hypothetical protein
VPWAICGTGIAASGLSYNEPAAVKAGVMMLDPGFRLMEHFLLH